MARAFELILVRRNKARLFVFLALCGAGVGVVFLSQIEGLDHLWGQVLQALGDALLIAGLLALVADPFVQQRFAEEWGHGLFWAIFNLDAPPPHQGGRQQRRTT